MAESGWGRLVDALRQYGVHYLTSGESDESSSLAGGAALDEPGSLLRCLAGSRHARLQDAIIALLLLHPEYAAVAMALLREAQRTASEHEVLHSRLIAAACLQRLWRFTLTIYRPDQPLIPASVVDGTSLPSPDEDFGRPCLRALGEQLAEQVAFPFNYEAQFSRVAELVIADLIAEANHAAGRSL
jgi:hypothetical protein